MAEDVFFTADRRKVALFELRKIMEYADSLGIKEHVSPGFGTLLGVVMLYDFIRKDQDMDMCVDTDHVTHEQEDAFFELIKSPIEIPKSSKYWKVFEKLPKPPHYKQKEDGTHVYKRGLWTGRHKGPTHRSDNGRILWMSIGILEVPHGVKSCVWFTFRYNGYVWHTKGRVWTGKFLNGKYGVKPEDDAIAKGVPAEYYDQGSMTTKFHGVDLNVPVGSGELCDMWYKAWSPWGGGKSSKKATLNIPKWSDHKRWRVRVKG